MSQDWLNSGSTVIDNPKPLPDGSVVFNLPPSAADAAKEAREAAKEERATQEKQFRTMTPAEVAAQGLPTGGVYQINGLGEVKTIKAASETGQNPGDAKVTAAQNVRRQLTQMQEIYDRSFKGADAFEYLPSADKSAFRAIATAMRADLKPLIRGPGEGTFTDSDQLLLDSLVPDPNNLDAYNEQTFKELDARINLTLQQFGGGQAGSPAGGGLASAPVTEEESAAAFGEPLFDADGNPVGPDYQGDYYDKDGKFLSLQVRVGDDSPVQDPRDEMGLLEGIGETLTGSERSTPEIEALPDWSTMPAPGLSGFLASLGSMVSSAEETAQILQAQGLATSVRQDAKGNFILTGQDGKEYAIKPGFRASDIPRAAGAVLAFTPAGRAATLPGAIAANAGTQAGIEALQAGTGGSFDTAEVVAAGAGGALGQQTVRGINAVQAARQARPAARSNILPDAGDVVEAGGREGVPVMTSDVRRPTTWLGRWLTDMGEKLPVIGTSGARADQQAARVNMVERLAEDYASNPATIDDVAADFMKTRGAEVAKYAQQKREVFGDLAGAPPPEATQAIAVLDRAIGNLGDQATFAPLSRQLQAFRSDLAGARSINDVERLRKAFGDVFQDDSLKAMSSEMRAVMDGPNGLYAAVKKDMGEYIRANGGDKALRKWEVANGRLADFAGDLEQNTVKRVLAKGEATPEEAAKLLFSKNESDIRTLYKNLSEEGRKRARSLVVQKVIDDAGGLDELSTAKFTTALGKASKTYGIVFPKAEADRIAGIHRLMQVTSRAERANLTTPTGQQLLPFAGGGIVTAIGSWLGGASGAAVGGAGALGVAGGFRFYESKAMRNLLMSLAKTQPGSKAESNVMGNITKLAAKTTTAPVASNVVSLPAQGSMRVGASPLPLAAEDQNTRADRTTTGGGAR